MAKAQELYTAPEPPQI